jgi:SAM-dependent methyltransferase
MVGICRANFPDADIRVGDARDLSELASDHFTLVFFSNNGIDAVDHAERGAVLREFARVVRPGGNLVYSTHNLRGGSFAERPGQLHRPHESFAPSLHAALSLIEHAPSRWRTYRRQRRAYLRTRAKAVSGDGWATAPLRAHGYEILAHFVTIDDLRTEVESAGLEVVAIWTLEGDVVSEGQPETGTHYFHVHARKPDPGEIHS